MKQQFSRHERQKQAGTERGISGARWEAGVHVERNSLGSIACESTTFYFQACKCGQSNVLFLRSLHVKRMLSGVRSSGS